MQFTHILLPVDGSVYSDNATRYAVYLAKMSGARITLVSCYEWCGHMIEMSDAVIEELKSKLTRESAIILEEASQILKSEGIGHDVKLERGAPGAVLATLAKSKQYDLIIMGSHGHSDIAGLFLGSVTHKVLNTIYCPVLVVPGE
jgi:nucleotide-binding universal stress UspA family protein